jgi:hypothetical protein
MRGFTLVLLLLLEGNKMETNDTIIATNAQFAATNGDDA